MSRGFGAGWELAGASVISGEHNGVFAWLTTISRLVVRREAGEIGRMV
jgi:hypothetical protein